MADEYDALRAKWAMLSGTTGAKLAAINAALVAGPKADVAVSSVVGKLMLSGSYLTLAAFAQGAPNNNAVHDAALGSAKMLMTIITIPNAPAFQMSDPQIYSTVKGLMDAILAQETAVSGSTGFSKAVHDALLALADTTQPWWQASIADGGGALRGTVALSDLAAAGGLT